MSIDAFGLIYTGEENAELRELTFSRTVAAVPFAGRYRTIDFVLSSIVNSGISNVGLIAQRNYHSLIDHLGSGKEWDLHRKRDGLFILPPFVTRDNPGIYRGTIDAIRSAMSFIRRSKQSYVILTGSHTVYNTTFNAMLKRHIETGADITIMYNEQKYRSSKYDEENSERFDDLRLKVDETGRVTDLAFNSNKPISNLMGLDAYIISKNKLEYLIEDAAAHGEVDFMRGVLIKNLHKEKFYGYRYDGYAARLNSVEEYYRHNIELLDPAVAAELFNPRHPIYTKVKDEVPARYVGSGSAKNCIIADGCIIEGEVESSVLFRGVHIEKGAKVKNSIIMQGSHIGENCDIDHTILDKHCTVNDGKRLSGDVSYPMIMRKKTTI